MNQRFEEKDAFEVYGIERIFRPDEMHKVPEFWKELLENGEEEKLYKETGAQAQSGGLHCVNAICGYKEDRDEDGDEIFPYLICAFRGPNSDVTGYKAAQVPKSLWSVFRSDESPSLGDKLPSLFGYAYNEWLPSSGYIRANGPEMEFYYTLDNGLHAEEAWIPVKKA